MQALKAAVNALCTTAVHSGNVNNACNVNKACNVKIASTVHKAGKVNKACAQAMSTKTVTFQRVWTNKYQESRLNAVSVWRPVPPQGYVAVGDCLVSGTWAPPSSALVLRQEAHAKGVVAPPVVRPAFFVHAHATMARA